MSQSSFPRAEHVTALQAYILQRASESGLELAVANSGLDRYRCHYQFTLKCQAAAWAAEISIHFQLAANLLAGKSSEALDRQLVDVLRHCRAARKG